MFSRTIITLVIVSSLLGLFPQRIISQELKISELSITEQINHFAKIYNVDGSLVKAMVKCESNGDLDAIGDGGRAFGVLQYHKASFERHAKLFGEELDYYSSYDQIKLTSWALSKGYGREWTSYRSIKNGGKYSFYSTLLKKHFVTYCSI